MKRTILVVGILLEVMLAGAAVFWGCNSESKDRRLINSDNQQSSGRVVTVEGAAFMVTDMSQKSAALKSVLLKDNVPAARTWLQSQGYTPVDSCLAVFVRYKYKVVYDSTLNPPSSAARPNPLPGSEPIIVAADTMVWQAFANPSHDMGNYTGIATAWRNGEQSETILAELDICGARPKVIRQGSFEDGTFHSGDVGVDNFKDCVGDCIPPVLVGCAFAGPGYLECVGAGAIGCVIYCSAKSLWHAIFD
jgi:hypothetical protein